MQNNNGIKRKWERWRVVWVSKKDTRNVSIITNKTKKWSNNKISIRSRKKHAPEINVSFFLLSEQSHVCIPKQGARVTGGPRVMSKEPFKYRKWKILWIYQFIFFDFQCQCIQWLLFVRVLSIAIVNTPPVGVVSLSEYSSWSILYAFQWWDDMESNNECCALLCQ